MNYGFLESNLVDYKWVIGNSGNGNGNGKLIKTENGNSQNLMQSPKDYKDLVIETTSM